MQSEYNCFPWLPCYESTSWIKIRTKSCMSFYVTRHIPTLINRWLPSCMVYRAVNHCCVARRRRAVCWQPATASDVVAVCDTSATAAVSPQSWRQRLAASQHNAKYAAAQWLLLRARVEQRIGPAGTFLNAAEARPSSAVPGVRGTWAVSSRWHQTARAITQGYPNLWWRLECRSAVVTVYCSYAMLLMMRMTIVTMFVMTLLLRLPNSVYEWWWCL